MRPLRSLSLFCALMAAPLFASATDYPSAFALPVLAPEEEVEETLLEVSERLSVTEYDWGGPLLGWSKKQRSYLKKLEDLRTNSYLKEHCDKDLRRKIFRVARKVLIRGEFEYLDEMMTKVYKLIEQERVTKKNMTKIYKKLYLFEDQGIKKDF